MTTPPQPPDRAQVLARLIYPSRYCSLYDLPSIPEQIEASLRRQRKQHVAFPVAWQRCCGNLAYPHEGEDRHEWYALVSDPAYRDLWRSAYERAAHPALDCTEVLRRSLEYEAQDARHRHTERGTEQRFAA